MNPTATSIKLTNCAKTFADGTQALKPLNLTVKAGETIVLLGPSGCGKTTLLRIIAGLEATDQGGEIYFNQQNMTSIAIEKRNIGMVFQSYALFPNMSVAQNIVYGLKIRKLKPQAIKQRLDEMLEMMQIEALAHRRIDQLSGGQRQRVALARAIAVRPNLLLLDEPLTALDASLRDRLRSEISELLQKLGITSIYVTHDQSEAMALADRIVVMDEGRIVQIGSPYDIYHRPKNEFVANFVGNVNQHPHVFNTDYLTLFRPEDAEIVEPSKGEFEAKIMSVLFLGDKSRLTLDCGFKKPIYVDTTLRQDFKTGMTISIYVEPERLIRLKTTDNSSAAVKES
ncbi:MAG: ABC transporter ATP-binding protein [Hyphomicrobiales bacterium]|nr:MAG: ABC transporter ATP-binding protein [Hyphomicrobiales bacterium]